VLYDPSVTPRVTGRFRYHLRPVPLPPPSDEPRRVRRFHPKLVILAGQDHGGRDWVYLAVSSANLTISGWGRNVESFGETWITTRNQQAHAELLGLLGWLQDHAPLGERADLSDGITRARTVLERMGAGRRPADEPDAPWSGLLNHWFYASPLHETGFPRWFGRTAFLGQERQRPPAVLCVYSPYWGDVRWVCEGFGAGDTAFVTSRKQHGSDEHGWYGFPRAALAELPNGAAVYTNERDIDERFWHLKAYYLETSAGTSARCFTAVGSCNATGAGLLGGARGNVEAMLVQEADGTWLPEGRDETADPEELDTGDGGDDAPPPAPLALVVAWDWRDRVWRWWLDLTAAQSNPQLSLANQEPFAIEAGTAARLGAPPPRKSTYKVTWSEGGEVRSWTGAVLELGLDHSERSYERRLTMEEILDSWRGRGRKGTGSPRGEGLDEDEGEDDVEVEGEPTVFDAVNLYDLFRAVHDFRVELSDHLDDPDTVRGLMLKRPNSARALWRIATASEGNTAVRYLVLREVGGLFDLAGEVLDDADLLAGIRGDVGAARELLLASLSHSTTSLEGTPDQVLEWFEAQLDAQAGGGAA